MRIRRADMTSCKDTRTHQTSDRLTFPIIILPWLGNPLFNKTRGEVSRKYPLGITPIREIFNIIWPVIYAFQGLWMGLCLVSIFVKTKRIQYIGESVLDSETLFEKKIADMSSCIHAIRCHLVEDTALSILKSFHSSNLIQRERNKWNSPIFVVIQMSSLHPCYCSIPSDSWP